MAGGCGSGRACARLSVAFKAAREREGSAGCRWRAALKAGRGQRRGQVRGRACLSQRRRRGAPLMASRGAARGGRAAAVMEWEGGSAGERAGEHSRPGIEHGGSGAARHARRARLPALRAGEGQRGREREGREKERGEGKKSPLLDLVQTRIFQLKLEKF